MVMNERKRVESLLEKGDLSENTYKDLQLLTKYYLHDEHIVIKEELKSLLNSFLENNIHIYYEWEWEETIERIINEEIRNPRPLTDISEIYVTEEEISTISKLKTRKQKRYLFALIVYARYLAQVKGIEETGWTYSDVKSQEAIIASANNNKLPFKEQHMVAKQLIDLGLISQPNYMESVSIKVECMNNSGNTALWVNSFEDLGVFIENWLKINKEGYKICERCSKPYKPKAKDTRSKYCNSCKKIVTKEKNAKYYAKKTQN